MTSPSNAISSSTPLQEPCCCCKLLTNRSMLITFLIVGLLAIICGYTYLNNTPRIVTMAFGALSCALFLIGTCKNSYALPAAKVSSSPTPKGTPLKNSDNIPIFVFSVEELRENPIGAALLAACEKGWRSVINICSPQCRQGWTIYVQDSAPEGSIFRVLLTPLQKQEGLFWQPVEYTTSDDKGINKTKFRDHCETTEELLQILTKQHPTLFLVEDPFYDKIEANLIREYS